MIFKYFDRGIVNKWNAYTCIWDLFKYVAVDISTHTHTYTHTHIYIYLNLKIK